MRAPLWLTVTGTGAKVTVSLATCRNCGKTKIASDPCGLDHAAALMEFGQAHPNLVAAIRDAKDDATTPDPSDEPGARAEGESL